MSDSKTKGSNILLLLKKHELAIVAGAAVAAIAIGAIVVMKK